MVTPTLDNLAAGMQPLRPLGKTLPTTVAGRPHSLWYAAGFPGAGSMDNSTSGGVALSSSSTLVNGQMPHYDPGAGTSFLARLQASAPQGGTLQLCDRLWHGSDVIGGTVLSVTSTSLQTLTSFPGLPARDENGSSNGQGVLAAVEVYSALGAGTPTWTLGYHNQANASGKTAVNLDPVVASSAVGAFYRFGLQAGDTGIRTPDTFQSSATSTSGNFGLVLYRVLAQLELNAAFTPNAIDVLTAGLPKLLNGVVPFLVFIPNTTTGGVISGGYTETQPG